MNPVAFVSSEPIRPSMGGIGIRYVEFACRMFERGIEVLLLTPGNPEDVPEMPFPRSCVLGYTPGTLATQVTNARCVVAQGQAANELVASRMPQPLVIDLYDPFLIENLYYVPRIGSDQYRNDLASFRGQMTRGDFFLCASETQRLYYLGFLTAMGRLGSERMIHDPDVRSLIDLVPFGTRVPETHQPVLPEKKDGEKRILMCGMYDWYNPWPFLEALQKGDHPDWTLLFMRNPNQETTPQGVMGEVLAWESGRSKGTFRIEFHDWVPAERRFDLLQDVDLMVVPHDHGLETWLSLRTRMIDALAAGCPVVASSGGTMSDLIAQHEAGWVVPAGNGEALVAGMEEVLQGGAEVEQRLERGQAFAAQQFGWDTVLGPLLAFCEAPRRQSEGAGETLPNPLCAPEPTELFSIVIPTHNRWDRLEEVLEALSVQISPPPFEVIVVDDGSRETAPESISPQAFPKLNLTLLRQENTGPAGARNLGVERAQGEMIVFLGDDTVPGPQCLAAHADAHAGRSHCEALAVVGHIDWHPAIRQTAFLRYIQEEGVQFGFKVIKDPENLPHTYFYGSNLSLRRSLVVEEPFSPAFTDAAWEDTELGLRLKKKRGLHLVYQPQAKVSHLHPMTFSSFCRRQFRVGRYAPVFCRLHPEQSAQFGVSPEGPYPLPPRFPIYWKTLLIRICEPFNVSLPDAWHEVLRYHFLLGQHDLWDEVVSSHPEPPIQFEVH